MSSTMTSIRSILIRTCMSNIQKEVSQLEHWLNNLQEDASSVPVPSFTQSDEVEMSNLQRVIDKLADQLGSQQLTLNNILERLDNLEGFSRPEREVFISENQGNDPWLDNCEPLENEIVINEDNMVPVYIKRNSLSTESTNSSIATPSIIPDIPEDKSILPEIHSETHSITGGVEESVEEEKEEVEVVEEEKEVVEVVEEEEVEEKEEEVEEVKEVEEVEEVEEEEVVEEEEIEEEEEEEGLELEEIEFKGVKYYKDAENFVYSIDEDEQPSENPIGFWKEKAQTIAFYKIVYDDRYG